ncbi:MAG TPA: hypothetical protein H9761_12405, partial [Candidatus Eisenbergiella merdavium]|nr:hypothetical protein [Candidatus Eisenbergiella merdavium]
GKYYNQKGTFDKRYGCKSRQKPLHIKFLSGRFHSHRHRIFYSLRLDVYEKNFSAIQLYESCGFSYRGTIDLGLEELYGLKWYHVYEKLL